jgi:hypothetical protein
MEAGRNVAQKKNEAFKYIKLKMFQIKGVISQANIHHCKKHLKKIIERNQGQIIPNLSCAQSN